MITAEVIKNFHSNTLSYLKGDLGNVAQKVLPPENCDAETLVFAGKKEQMELAVKANAPIIVIHKSLTPPEDSSSTFFSTPSIPLAMSSILPLFDGKMNRFNQETKIHPQSFIHPTAHIGKNVTVGPFVSIGEQARIGDGCTIGSNTVIESYAVIGDHSLLHGLVFIGSHCELGSHCEIHPHTTIGADGFSFALNAQGEPQKIPQIGRVVIGHHVEIGANCAVDRAALTETRIGNNTKFDNFCHIAHNVTIGNNGLMACSFKIAGSSHVGDNFMSGGDICIIDHISITDRVVIAGKSGITNNITEPGQYGGYPLEPFREHLRTLKNSSQVGRLRKQVARLMKHLNLQEEEEK